MIAITKPLVFLDLETTGVDKEKDKIVEICILKIFPVDQVLKLIENGQPANHVDIVQPQTIYHSLIHPEMHIPEQATAIHGITDQDVEKAPAFKEVAKEIFELIEDSDIAGFNSNRFDIPMLYFHLIAAGIKWNYKNSNWIDVCNIYKIKEERTLSAAFKFYTGADHLEAHGAEGDVKATLKILEAQLSKYEDLPKEAAALALYSNFNKPILDISGKFTTDAEGDVIFSFGKHVGKKCKSSVETKEYLQWIAGPKATFTEDTKHIARQLLVGNL